MKFNILKFVTNTKGQYQATVASTFDDFKSARTNYFNTAAAFSNADDVLVAAIKMVTEFGRDVDGYEVVIDNTPKPEPEEEEITEPEE